MSKIEKILEYINAIRLISAASTEDEMQTIKMLATEAHNELYDYMMKEKEYAKLNARQYIHNDGIGFCTSEEEVKQAHLAGLKAGKNMNVPTKWHKVADGDLPSEEGGWVCNQNGLPCFFDWGTEQWLDCEGTQIRTTEWCHMPHKE